VSYLTHLKIKIKKIIKKKKYPARQLVAWVAENEVHEKK